MLSRPLLRPLLKRTEAYQTCQAVVRPRTVVISSQSNSSDETMGGLMIRSRATGARRRPTRPRRRCVQLPATSYLFTVAIFSVFGI